MRVCCGSRCYRLDFEEKEEIKLKKGRDSRCAVPNDGVNWRTVQNYEKAVGSRAGYLQGKAKIGILAQKYAPDADALYIRIGASDTSQGFGAVVFGFTVYYQ